MSHTSSIGSVVISNVDALRSAIADLQAAGVKCSLLEKSKPRAFFENQTGMGVAVYVVKLEDAKYDVGLYARADGKGFEARTDFWGGSVERVLGSKASDPARAEQAKLGRLFQAYQLQVAKREAIRKGHSVRQIAGTDGTVKLIISGAGL